jgi:polyhydroxybutyrate depolymerase
MLRALALVPLMSCLALAACAAPRAPAKDGPDALTGGSEHEFSIPDFDKRNYILHLPPSYAPGEPIPVVLALHGGGGKARGALKVTCPQGDDSHEDCLTKLGDREGFAVVAPNGTGNALLGDVRTWNAGGGQDGWQCVSGEGCKDDVDDLAYFDALHDELMRAIDVDEARVFSTGLSNGGAMSHRLACDRAARFAAVASVGGGNQVAVVQGCTPERAVPVMEIHGDEDPCWTFEESTDACAQQDGLKKVGTRETIAGWVDRNGCATEPRSEQLEDKEDDGTRTTVRTHGDCDGGADVVLVEVMGGGHTWPGGHGYLGEDTIGRTSRDFLANKTIWSFFQAHPLR